MAGELTQANIAAAERAGGFNAEVLKRTEDAYSPAPEAAVTLDEFKARMDKAGHRMGAGYDGCAECQQFAAMLPDMIQQALAQGQQPQAG